MSTKEIGNAGEDLACAWAKDRGWVILERNYRCRFGEIDLIARDGGILIFAEVKTRNTDRFGTGREAVDYRKQCRLHKTAAYYLACNPKIKSHTRFDVIECNLNKAAVEHIPGAFEVPR